MEHGSLDDASSHFWLSSLRRKGTFRIETTTAALAVHSAQKVNTKIKLEKVLVRNAAAGALMGRKEQPAQMHAKNAHVQPGHTLQTTALVRSVLKESFRRNQIKQTSLHARPVQVSSLFPYLCATSDILPTVGTPKIQMVNGTIRKGQIPRVTVTSAHRENIPPMENLVKIAQLGMNLLTVATIAIRVWKESTVKNAVVPVKVVP